ncbi:uncharacterized protein [Argopecten irradians]|uniref:uncharacterized protein n=1 Tax=Argopecten irradians TaxID=31199 RepID=UPI00371C3A2A
MPRKKKDIYRKYPLESLEKAVDAVHGGMSIRKASSKFSIPRSTILDHAQGRVSSGAKMGRPAALSEEVEANIVKQALDASEKGFGLSRGMLMAKTGRVVKALKLRTPFKNNVPGTMWWRGLKQRHPELVIRKPEKLSSCRSSMMNPVIIRKYFNDLSDTITKLGLAQSPARIWNADEKGFQMEHSPVSVCARKGSRSLPGRTSNSRESISTLACVNAAGAAMPPLCVVRGKTRRSLDSFATDKAPAGTVWTWQEKAWMTDILGQNWFNDVFLKHCGPERPQLLILDSHSSHEVLGLLESAKSENIHVFALPPHTTQYLQPLDRTVFGPLSKAYNRACTNFMSASPTNTICKLTWPELFATAWKDAVTCHNILSGFRACGIFPFNSNAVPAAAFSTSVPFDVALASVPQSSSSPSVPQSSSSPSVPESSYSPSVPQSSSSPSVPQSSSSPSVPQSSASPSIPQSSSSQSFSQASSSQSVPQPSSSRSVAGLSSSQSVVGLSSSQSVAGLSSSQSVAGLSSSQSVAGLSSSQSVAGLSSSQSVAGLSSSQSVAGLSSSQSVAGLSSSQSVAGLSSSHLLLD